MGAGASFNGYADADAVLAKATENLKACPDNRCCKYILQLKESGKLDEMSAEDLSKLFLCAKTGLDNVESGLGCYAMGPKDYEDFGFFFGRCNDSKRNKTRARLFHIFAGGGTNVLFRVMKNCRDPRILS